MSKMSRLFILLFIGLKCSKGTEDESHRTKRQILYPPPLVYPFGGTFKIIIGLAVPVQLSGKILVYGQNFQFQYAVPPNATLFTNFFEDVSASRRRRRRKSIARDERMTVYKLFEQELERQGIDGKSCLKKSICEAAAIPLKDEGLIGELLHLLLTPPDKNNSLVDSEYLQALENGRSQKECSTIYSTCPTGWGLLDKISTVFTL